MFKIAMILRDLHATAAASMLHVIDSSERSLDVSAVGNLSVSIACHSAKTTGKSPPNPRSLTTFLYDTGLAIDLYVCPTVALMVNRPEAN